MTSKIQIDDEMIRRFREAAGPYLGLPKPPCGALLSEEAIRDWKKEVARGILEKTLAQAAPEEPEIPVSEGMVKAAWTTIIPNEVLSDGLFIAAYRAMEKARRKEEVPQQRFHCREGEMRPGGILRAHRRKGDPK